MSKLGTVLYYSCHVIEYCTLKRSLEDPIDRAQKHRKTGTVRLPLDDLEFLQQNRAGLGIDSYHANEVAWDCEANMIKLLRYRHVCVVRLPANKLERFRSVNRQKCESDALMPAYSPKMRYCMGVSQTPISSTLASLALSKPRELCSTK